VRVFGIASTVEKVPTVGPEGLFSATRLFDSLMSEGVSFTSRTLILSISGP
jgi:hypothetical protein